MWEDFAEEIKQGNRFFPKAKLLDEIKKLREKAVYEIPLGTIFYRARLYNSYAGHLLDVLVQFPSIIQKYIPSIVTGESLFDFGYQIRLLDAIIQLKSTDSENYSKMEKELLEVWDENYFYWGYDADDSDAPPPDKAPAGRANPKGISYLYLTEDIKTALLEVRPNQSQLVSVGIVKTLKPLNVFDFCYIGFPDQSVETNTLYKFSAHFSAPNYNNDELDYYPTQYLCEYIKELGFDGIRFRSSLNPGGNNVVLFDTSKDPSTNHKNYDITESKIYTITQLDLKYELTLPLPNDEAKS